MLFKNVVDFAVIQEKLIFRPPYWPPFWKKLSKISDNLTRYQVNLNVLKYPIKSFLAITFRFDGFFPYLSPSKGWSSHLKLEISNVTFKVSTFLWLSLNEFICAKYLNKIFTEWKSMLQGFRIYFVWNPRLKDIVSPW